MEAHPAWPVVALAAFQLGDAVTVAVNPPFIQAANNRVNTPPGIRRVLPLVKAAAGGGLLLGLGRPRVGQATSAALAAYFVTAIGFHVRARDTVLNSVPAVAMLGVAIGAGTCFD